MHLFTQHQPNKGMEISSSGSLIMLFVQEKLPQATVSQRRCALVLRPTPAPTALQGGLSRLSSLFWLCHGSQEGSPPTAQVGSTLSQSSPWLLGKWDHVQRVPLGRDAQEHPSGVGLYQTPSIHRDRIALYRAFICRVFMQSWE